MSTTPKQIEWKKANWHQTDTALANSFGVTRQGVSAARRNHSPFASPAGHGGVRANSGRKPAPSKKKK